MTNEVSIFRPFEDLRSVNETVDRMLGAWRRWPSVLREGVQLLNIDRTLPVDIYDQDNAMIVKAALPGVDPSDVDVSIHEGLLQINAETKSEESIDEADYHRREYSYGKWSRSFQLPNNVAADKAEASYDNGMLRLKIPYTDSETQRTIKIEVK